MGAIPAMGPQVAPFSSGGTQLPHMHGGLPLPPYQNGLQWPRNPDFSNVYKRFNNWNVCFSCGFDIKNGHTSLTCPFKKANHQMLFVRENAQQFIVVGYDPCISGMHKTVLPAGCNT